MTPDVDDPATRQLTTAQAARAAHVDEAVIRRWASRGLIASVSDDPDHPLYLELAVLQAEAKTRRKARELRLAAEAAAEFGQAA